MWVHAHWHGALSSRTDITFGNKAEGWKKVLARPLSSCIPLETLECVCIFMCVCVAFLTLVKASFPPGGTEARGLW